MYIYIYIQICKYRCNRVKMAKQAALVGCQSEQHLRPCRDSWFHIDSQSGTFFVSSVFNRFQAIISHRIHVCYIYIYMVTWIPSIYPSHILAYIPAPWILWVLPHTFSIGVWPLPSRQDERAKKKKQPGLTSGPPNCKAGITSRSQKFWRMGL